MSYLGKLVELPMGTKYYSSSPQKLAHYRRRAICDRAAAMTHTWAEDGFLLFRSGVPDAVNELKLLFRSATDG